jgi:hypothetical protein
MKKIWNGLKEPISMSNILDFDKNFSHFSESEKVVCKSEFSVFELLEWLHSSKENKALLMKNYFFKSLYQDEIQKVLSVSLRENELTIKLKRLIQWEQIIDKYNQSDEEQKKKISVGLFLLIYTIYDYYYKKIELEKAIEELLWIEKRDYNWFHDYRFGEVIDLLEKTLTLRNNDDYYDNHTRYCENWIPQLRQNFNKLIPQSRFWSPLTSSFWIYQER